MLIYKKDNLGIGKVDGILKMVRLTKAEYDALTVPEQIDPSILYDISDVNVFDPTKYVEKEDVLSTKEELAANNNSGKLVDSLVVKELNDSLTASDNLQFRFATDGEGNYGYLKADDSFVPFSNLDNYKTYRKSGSAYISWSNEYNAGMTLEQLKSVVPSAKYIVGCKFISTDAYLTNNDSTGTYMPHVNPNGAYMYISGNTSTAKSYSYVCDIYYIE